MKALPLVLILSSTIVLADETDIVRCAAIADDASRLSCYDAAVERRGITEQLPAATMSQPRLQQHESVSQSGSTAASDLQHSEAAATLEQAAAMSQVGTAAENEAGEAASASQSQPPATAVIEATQSQPQPQARPPVSGSVTSGEEQFGLERYVGYDVDSVRSRYDGQFVGWSGRTLFKLENGQVWRQIAPSTFRTTMDRPVIIIERAALGSYRLKVEGLNRSVRVKRIR